MNAKAPYADCTNCPLRNRPCVPSYLPEDPTMIIVGEAPGRNEVQQGQPFVGMSGKLIDKVVASAGHDPARIARVNAVLCHPENNVTPPAAAIHACSKRFAAEINTSGARVIVPVGNVALSAVDDLTHRTRQQGGTITTRRGQWYDLAHFRVLPTYHPAYVLRSPKHMTTFRTDLQRALNAAVNNDPPFDTNDIRYIPCNAENRHRVIEYLERMPDGAVLAFDVESDTLQWYDTPTTPAARLLALGMAWQNNRVVIIPAGTLVQDKELFDVVTRAFARGKPTAHNGKFDQHHLKRIGIEFNLTYDTMLAHYALNEEKGTHDLKTLVTERLNCSDDYETRLITSWFVKNKISQENRRYGAIPVELLYEYLAIDVAATLQLWKRLEKELRGNGLYDWPFLNVLMPVSNAFFHMEENGIRIDRDYLKKLGVHIDKEKASIKMTMQVFVAMQVTAWLDAGGIKVPITNWIKDKETYARCIQKLRDDFNPSSWQQVQVLIYDVLKLKHTKELGYKTDPRSTAEDALLSVQPNDTHGFIDLLMEYRRLEKIHGTYVTKLLELADIKDRVHINYLIHGTEIGRLSATDALHGIPRPGSDAYGAAIRGAFIASPGNVLVIADFSQAELRTFAAESKEPTMLEPYNNGGDLHDETSVMIAPGLADYFKHMFLADHNDDWQATKACKLCKEIRTIAKNVNFGEIYQGGAYGIWSMLGGKIPIEYVRAVLQIKRERQKVAAAWKERQFRFAKTHGYVKTRTGRLRRFPLITEDNLDEVRKASVHAPIAGGASDLTALSIVEIDNAGYRVCGTWHDSLICDVPRVHADACAAFVTQTMIGTGEKWYPEVAWEVDIERDANGEYPTRWYPAPPTFD